MIIPPESFFPHEISIMPEADRSSLRGLDSGAVIRSTMRGRFLQKRHYLTTWEGEHGALNPLRIHFACTGHGVTMSTDRLAVADGGLEQFGRGSEVLALGSEVLPKAQEGVKLLQADW